MKTKERETVRRLRREEGRSIKEIAAVVGVSVSSVSLWVRDIELTSSQLADLQRRNPAFGTCRLAVHDTSIVQGIFGSIQEYGGFERPEWLG